MKITSNLYINVLLPTNWRKSSLIHTYRRLLQNVSTISCSHLQVALIYKGYILSKPLTSSAVSGKIYCKYITTISLCGIDVYSIKLYWTQIKIKWIQDMKLVKFTSRCLIDFFLLILIIIFWILSFVLSLFCIWVCYNAQGGKHFILIRI